MPIRFRCNCGKLLEADDGTAGKRTRCPACSAVCPIPAAPTPAPAQPDSPGTGAPGLRLEDGASSGAASCPHCGQVMAPGAILCIACGYNANTGGVMGASGPATQEAPEEDEAPAGPFDDLDEPSGPRIALPAKQLVVGGVLVLVAALGYFFVVKPMISGMDISSARAMLTNGDLDKAAAEYQKIRPKLDADKQALCDLRIKQIALEKKLNAGRVASDGQNLNEPRELEMTLNIGKHSGGALSFKIHFRNSMKKPVTLKKDYFYIRGASDLVTVHEHEDNNLGQTVKPGERAEGLAHFRRLPQFKANRKLGRRTEQVYFMMYNDGTHYVKWLLPF